MLSTLAIRVCRDLLGKEAGSELEEDDDDNDEEMRA
jgi:hypothetical protein